MKKEFIKVAKELGFDVPTVRYERPERDVVVYYLSIYKNGELVKVWDIGYFIGEVDTANSKDRVIPEFRELLNAL
jgi:hypothetical protein